MIFYSQYRGPVAIEQAGLSQYGMAWREQILEVSMYMPAVKTERWVFQSQGSTATMRVDRRHLRLLWRA